MKLDCDNPSQIERYKWWYNYYDLTLPGFLTFCVYGDVYENGLGLTEGMEEFDEFDEE